MVLGIYSKKNQVKVNPLTYLLGVMVYLILVFQTTNSIQLILLGSLLLISLIIVRSSISFIFRRMKPFFLFLPVMFCAYIILTGILTDKALTQIIGSIGVSALRIILMITAMSIFLELTNATDLLDAIRTQWYRTGLRWRFVEDLFQLLYLTFRFFPTLKEEIREMNNFERALGIFSSDGNFVKIKRTALRMPGLIANSLYRADNLGLTMELRGYGRVIPRSVSSSIPFTLLDICIIIFILLLSIGFFYLA